MLAKSSRPKKNCNAPKITIRPNWMAQNLNIQGKIRLTDIYIDRVRIYIYFFFFHTIFQTILFYYHSINPQDQYSLLLQYKILEKLVTYIFSALWFGLTFTIFGHLVIIYSAFRFRPYRAASLLFNIFQNLVYISPVTIDNSKYLNIKIDLEWLA